MTRTQPKPRCWGIAIQAVIVLWLVSFTLMGIPGVATDNEWLTPYFVSFDVAVQLMFLLEFLVRLVNAHPKKAYVFSAMGIIDLMVALPMLLVLFGANPAEIGEHFRIVQVLCIFKLARFNRRATIIKQAFMTIRRELLFFASLFAFLLYFLSLGVMVAESEAQPQHFGSMANCLWFAVETLTTVGYGDEIPVTPMGKFFTSGILIVGVALIAIPTSLITSSLSRLWLKEEHQKHLIELRHLNARTGRRATARLRGLGHDAQASAGSDSRQ